MYWVDIIALILTLIMAYRAQQHGLLTSAMRLIGLVVGIIVAVNLGAWAGDMLISQFNITQELANIIGYILVFIIVLLAAQVVGYFLRSIIHAIKLGWLDRIGGIFLGTLKAAIIISLLFWVLMALPSDTLGKEIQEKSIAYSILGEFTPTIYEKYIQPNLDEGDMKDRLDSLISPTTPSVNIMSDFEEQVEELSPGNQQAVEDMKERFQGLPLSKQMTIMSKLTKENPDLQEIINILYEKE